MRNISVEIEVEDIPDNYPGIVPILMDLDDDGVYFEIYRGLEEHINSFLDKFQDRLFTKEAFEYLCACTDSFLEGMGYKRDTYGQTRFYKKFIINDPEEVNASVIKPNTVLMNKELGDLPNLTTLFTQDTNEIPPLSFVSVEDGKIVSVATVNDTDSKTVKEITVNTQQKYRGRGFGASNTAALTKYLSEQGYKVAYCVSNYNKASIKIAKKCGFKENGKFYAVSAYKTNYTEED